MDTPISTLISASIVGILILLGGSIIMSSYSLSNPSIASNEVTRLTNNSQSYYTQMGTSAANIQSSIQQANKNPGLFGFLDTLINVGYNMLLTLFSGLGFITNFILYIPTALGIPAWVAGLGTMFISMFIALAIAGAIFRKNI